jgi:hypothetical protein
VLSARYRFEGGPREASIEGDQIDARCRGQTVLLAVGSAVGVVVVAIGPDLQVNWHLWRCLRFLGTRRRYRRKQHTECERAYSSQPH